MNPKSGTFVTMDTYQGTINDPVSLHKYLYANANPVMNIDPTGKFTLGEMNVTQGIKNCISSAYSAMSKIYVRALGFIRNHVQGVKAISKSTINGIVTGTAYKSNGKKFGAGFVNGFISGLGNEIAEKYLPKNNYIFIIASQLSSSLGSLTEDIIYNHDKSAKEIVQDMGKSAAISIIGSMSSIGIKYAISMANEANSVARLCSTYDEKFGEVLTIFFEQVINCLTSMGE